MTDFTKRQARFDRLIAEAAEMTHTTFAEIALLVAERGELIEALKAALAETRPVADCLGPPLTEPEDVWPDWVEPARKLLARVEGVRT